LNANSETNPVILFNLIADPETRIYNTRNNILCFILTHHINKKNGGDLNIRFPENMLFKPLITKTYSPIEHIEEIVTKVFRNSCLQKVSSEMYGKLIDGQKKYFQSSDEHYKFAIDRKVTFNNRNYIIEASVAVVSTYLTSGKDIPIAFIKKNSYDPDMKQAYEMIKNANNIYRKKWNIDIIKLNNLELYRNFVLAILGYSTWIKEVDENWNYDDSLELNYDKEEHKGKIDLYTKYNNDEVNIEPDHIFISYFNNFNFPTKINEETFNSMKNFEINRWEMHKIMNTPNRH